MGWLKPKPDVPGPGQESVWDYPRPPALERIHSHIVIVLGGAVIVDATEGFRVLETSHPPVYYLPASAFAPACLQPSRPRASFCEWKGWASYFTLESAGRREVDVAWAYPDPTEAFRAMAGYVAVYPGRMDACSVDGLGVSPQPGGFYGGWITPGVTGPFKGGPGSAGW
jgi:uncharacterized protein (DUF427 family)